MIDGYLMDEKRQIVNSQGKPIRRWCALSTECALELGEECLPFRNRLLPEDTNFVGTCPPRVVLKKRRR